MGQLYDYYQGQDFVLIAVTKESVSAIQGWISTYGVQYAVGKDNGSNTFDAYYAMAGVGVPWHWLIDKNGYAIWNYGAGGDFNTYKTQIDALLAQ